MAFAPAHFPSFVYGTTRLGDDRIPFADRVELAKSAFKATGYIHTSDQYGDALKVLKEAFKETDGPKPNQVFKTGWESVDQIRDQILSQTATVGIEKMTVAQLCLGGGLAESLRTGDQAFEAVGDLRTEGLVDHFVLEVFPWTSQVPLSALEHGYGKGLIEALILYLNPLQRFATNELWDLIVSNQFPVVAMRTVSGGEIHELATRDSYLGPRAQEVLPYFEASGCTSWTEFCLRFAASFPFVMTTVGSTARRANLDEFVRLSSTKLQPLPHEVIEPILELQRKWSDEVDRHAEPWTM